MKKEIVDVNDGVVTEFHYSAYDSEIIINRVQDVEGILENNKTHFNNFAGKRGDIHPKADIPVVIIEKWNQELGDNCLLPRNREFLRRKLNDPDNKAFLLTPGKM